MTAWDKLDIAKQNLLQKIAEALGIYKIINWLNSKLK